MAELSTQLDLFYAEVDEKVRILASQLSKYLKCKAGCHSCCADDITVFRIEAEHIQRHNKALLENAIPHPPGLCAFLNKNGECRIYPYRPYVCRTQGLPLQWSDVNEDGDFVELRDICPINDVDINIMKLPRVLVWKIGPYESQLALLQENFGGESGRRISLRKLFKKEC